MAFQPLRKGKGQVTVIPRPAEKSPPPAPRLEIGFEVDTEGARVVPDPTDSPNRPALELGFTFSTQPRPGSTIVIPHHEIATRAYDIWVRNGCPHGTADADWYQAERELRAEAEALADSLPTIQGRL